MTGKRFQIYRIQHGRYKGRWRARLVSRNGKILMRADNRYPRKAGAVSCCRSVNSGLPIEVLT